MCVCVCVCMCVFVSAFVTTTNFVEMDTLLISEDVRRLEIIMLD